MTEDLEALIHSPLRLAIMSILIGAKEAEFNFLKEKTGATSGNLSVQIHKLGDAGYLEVEKSFRNNFPLTTCRITQKGIAAFEKYVKAIRKIIE
ncbi:MAG: transcriptional regulator [Robiginitalea sp.]|uniref:winged helix-turn-helix domain-containing protein n=1 Tax=Robiginitalea sp. TaxID=1902411 RepID=UPI003C70D45B